MSKKKCKHTRIYREDFKITFFRLMGGKYVTDSIHNFSEFYCALCRKMLRGKSLDEIKDRLVHIDDVKSC